MPSRTTSPNFAFLAKHDEVLVRHAVLAERYVFEDPNSALIKLRQFAELLAKHTAACVGVAVEERDKFLEILDSLWNARIINPPVTQLFHGLRKAGNSAAHGGLNDRREALHQLRMAHKLAVWFQKAFRHPGFKAGAFVPPPNPADAENELQTELEHLREALAAANEEAEGIRASAEQHARKREEAEAAAATAYGDLNAALELVEESEQQFEQERQELQQRLNALQQTNAAAPPAEREAITQAAQQAGEELDLDEAATRRIIDTQLREAGWQADTQSLRYGNGARPVKGSNLAIAEWPTANGPADYCLFVGLQPVAVVEAKRQTTDVASAIQQAKRYSRGYSLEGCKHSPGGPWEDLKIPFLFSTNGKPFLRQVADKSGIWFLDGRRSTNHARPLSGWYTPEGLTHLLSQDHAAADERLAQETTSYLPLRDYQAEAVRAIEEGIAAGSRELLVAMATGTGKTITCIGLLYRLIKTNRFRRILFLVDRSVLGEQAFDKLQDVRLENLQTFPEIYDVKQLGDLRPESDTRLHIATVQSMVKRQLYPAENATPAPVDWYDCIVIDECHRGYNLDQEMSDAEQQYRSEADYISKYRRVIDHFDAVRIGLTATPALHTTEIFGRPVFQYGYRQAVIDGWLVDYEPPFRIITQLSAEGIRWEQNDTISVLNARTNTVELFDTPDEVEVEIGEFNRKVITENFNRVVCSALAAHIDPSKPGKTLIFCANDLHADMVVRLLKEALVTEHGPLADDAVLKITGNADKPRQLIRRYKNEKLPQVAVTVDLLTTGVDVPEITNIVFLRRVKSRILFEQMLGRATRLCADLYGPGEDKERFRVFDAVDIYSALEALSDMKPVVTRVSISFPQLVDELTSHQDPEFLEQVKDQLLAKLQRRNFTEDELENLQAATGFDRDGLINHVRNTPASELGAWFAGNSVVVNILAAVRRSSAQYLISDHADELVAVERGYGDATRPEDYLDAFRNYITENLNAFPALLVVTQRPRELTRAQLRELRLQLTDAGFTETNLRTAWRETTNQDIAATIIGYIRHVALDQPLVSHKERVQAAMQKITASRTWTTAQQKWLQRIGKQLEKEVIVNREAIDTGQFREMGGFNRLNKEFGGELETILQEIADAMWQAAA